MACLIGMAVYSTAENKKDECLEQTLQCLRETVDFEKHELGLSVNSVTDKTQQILKEFDDIITHLIINNENIGTALAINKIWRLRKPKFHCVKMDDDVDILSVGWLDDMEDAIDRDNKCGILSLKRNDLDESPDNPHPFYKSELKMLPHKKGERWYVTEVVSHTMGTVQLYNWRLINKMGGLRQMDGVYGHDDSLSAVCCQVAGFYSAFLHGIEIEHLDKGGTEYTKWKQDYAGKRMDIFNQYKLEYLQGKRDIYQPL